jgi:hypothetical protein
MREFIERIAASYSIEDLLYVLGKDEEWLLWRIKDELLRHKEDLLCGDEYYTGVYDD